jgi:capsular polysaccharide biosynthesis protein
VTDPVFPLNGGNGERERLGVYDDFAANGNPSADFVPGLVNLGFIKAAIWRSVWFVTFLAAVGLLGGLTYYVKYPKAYQASASLLITLSPYEESQTASFNNQAMAETSSVAALAMHKLGLQQSTTSFLKTYSISSTTTRVLTITASGPSTNQAQLRASAVASAFLTFRADELRAQQNLVVASLNQQVDQAKHRVDSLDTQIGQLSGQPVSSAQQSHLGKLRAQRTSAENTLSSLQQAVVGSQSTTLPALTAALKNSQVLSVTPIPYPMKRTLVTYVAIGLIGGLAVGLGIVILRALVSDRLRRRDDIAYALDAPVKLSVHTLRARRRLVPWPGRAAKRDRDMRRVIAHLRSAVPGSAHGPAGLAVVAVDDAPVVARAVAALATSYASQGNQVVTADLSSDAHLAHLLRVKHAGTHPVSRHGVNFMLAVPDRDDIAPIGPLPRAMSPTVPARAGDALVASPVSADLLLTLVTLDPALGGDYLATWATSAVVVVSAGQSSAAKIHAVGEMIRLAGIRLDSVVLIGADKTDESLGLTPRPDEQAGMGVLGR